MSCQTERTRATITTPSFVSSLAQLVHNTTNASLSKTCHQASDFLSGSICSEVPTDQSLPRHRDGNLICEHLISTLSVSTLRNFRIINLVCQTFGPRAGAINLLGGCELASGLAGGEAAIL